MFPLSPYLVVSLWVPVSELLGIGCHLWVWGNTSQPMTHTVMCYLFRTRRGGTCKVDVTPPHRLAGISVPEPQVTPAVLITTNTLGPPLALQDPGM